MKTLTKKQERVIKRLEKALEAVGKEGITLFGMDGNIHYVTKQAVKDWENEGEKKEFYGKFADAFCYLDTYDERKGEIKAKCYHDSGGW